MLKKILATAVAASVITVLGGCSTTIPAVAPASEPDNSAAEFVAALGDGQSWDFDPMISPAAALLSRDFVVTGQLADVVAGSNVFIDPAEKQHGGTGVPSVVLIVDIKRTLKAAHSFPNNRAYIEIPISGIANVDRWLATTPNLQVAAMGKASTIQPAQPTDELPADATRQAARGDGLWLQGPADATMLNPFATVDILPVLWEGADTVDEFGNVVAAAK